jgi:ferredoxin
MGHLQRLKDEYRDLAKRLGTGTGYAFVEPTDPRAWKGWQEILEILYTPADAELGARMPMFPETLPRLSKRLGIPEAELGQRLDAMCDKGIAMDLVDPKGGPKTYLLSPPLVGFFEFSFMRAQDSIPKKRIAHAFEDYFFAGDPAPGREFLDGDPLLSRTLAHETAFPEDAPEVLDWEKASYLVANARALAVSLCSCRHAASHRGTACEVPLETCMTLNAGAEFVIRHSYGRRIDSAQGLRILEQARELGLVHLADNVQGKPLFLCSCCKCCCDQLRGMSVYDVQGVNPSGFLATCDPGHCAGCSRCARACPVGAVSVVPRRGPAERATGRKNALHASIDSERCIGCGVCVGACKKGAMTLTRRKEPPHVPVNSVEKAVRIALEQNRLADLVFDQGSSLGARFLNRAMRAIVGLPPARRLLASEQLRSRFVAAALKRIPDPIP